MQNRHILVVEDDPDIIELLVFNLEREGYQVSAATSGEVGLATAQRDLPDLVLLDLMLPGMEGLEVCRALKARPETRHIPVVMLTARTEDADIVAGLEMGADDYITKPFAPRVVTARVKAVLRRLPRTKDSDCSIIAIHDLTIDPDRHQIKVAGASVELTKTQFLLVQTLASRPGWVFTRDQIVNAVRGEDVMVTDRTVDVHIAGTRKKLGTAGRYIETVRGIGYRFQEEP